MTKFRSRFSQLFESAENLFRLAIIIEGSVKRVKTYGESEMQLHTLLSWMSDLSECRASGSGRFADS